MKTPIIVNGSELASILEHDNGHKEVLMKVYGPTSVETAVALSKAILSHCTKDGVILPTSVGSAIETSKPPRNTKEKAMEQQTLPGIEHVEEVEEVEQVEQVEQVKKEKAAPKRNYTKAIRELIAQGKNDDEIFAELMEEFSLTPDKKYRVREVRRELEKKAG